jgi:hypothetical protein
MSKLLSLHENKVVAASAAGWPSYTIQNYPQILMQPATSGASTYYSAIDIVNRSNS